MNRFTSLLSLCCLLLLSACKSENFADEKSLFIGTWNWFETRSQGGWAPPFPIDSANGDHQFSLDINRRSKIKFIDNDEVQEVKPITVISFREEDLSPGGDDWYWFTIAFDEALLDTANGFISQDSLIITPSWPPEWQNDAIFSYLNYYVRE